MLWLQLFILFVCAASSVLAGDKVQLEKLLNQVAGIYKDPSAMAKGVDLSKTVLITGCNHGFLNHLHNFRCFAERLGMKFLVIAFDHKAHQYITTNTSMISYEMTGGAVGEVTGESTEFRSKQFNLITARKKEIVHDILSLGYDVLFSDTDVAMIKDPIPYMMFKNVDYVHSLNYMCKLGEPWDFRRSKIEGNTGFYFVRSNKNTIKLWADAFAAAPKYPKLDDQAIFWKVIRQSVDPSPNPLDKCQDSKPPTDTKTLTTCMVDTCMFSSGMLSRVYVPELTYETLLDNLKLLNESIVTVHANYLSGNKKKMQRMKEYGFWLATGEASPDGIHHRLTEKCNPYVQVPPNPANNIDPAAAGAK